MIWLARIALVACGVGVMAWEGSIQPAPGVGFAVSLAFFMAAAMIGHKETDNDREGTVTRAGRHRGRARR